MPTQRLSMRRIREVLRLRHQGLTERVIARMIGVSNGVVHGYLRRARLTGLTWPLPETRGVGRGIIQCTTWMSPLHPS
jgi:transposase